MFVYTAVVAIGVSVLVVVVCGNCPSIAAFNSNECPAVHAAFPVLVEDGDCANNNSVFCRGNVAVIKTFLHGDSLDGHGLRNRDRSCVNGAAHSRIAAVQGVMDGGSWCGTADGNFLCLIVGAAFRIEGRSGANRCATRGDEHVEEEVVLIACHVLGVVRTVVMVAVQGKGSNGVVDVGDDIAAVVGNH